MSTPLEENTDAVAIAGAVVSYWRNESSAPIVAFRELSLIAMRDMIVARNALFEVVPKYESLQRSYDNAETRYVNACLNLQVAVQGDTGDETPIDESACARKFEEDSALGELPELLGEDEAIAKLKEERAHRCSYRFRYASDR